MSSVRRIVKYATIGAGVTVVFGLIPLVGILAPFIGGGVAGYLAASTERHGATVGASAGGLVWLLLLPLVLFFGAAAAVLQSPAVLIMGVGITLASLAYLAATSALGGYLGAAVADPDKEPDASDPVAQIKARYVNGDLSELEFERRLEQHLDAEESERSGRLQRERDKQ